MVVVLRKRLVDKSSAVSGKQYLIQLKIDTPSDPAVTFIGLGGMHIQTRAKMSLPALSVAVPNLKQSVI